MTGSTDEFPVEVGYYYPEPYWGLTETSWIKTLLLFFDQLAILLPDYMYGRHTVADPTVAGALEDQGLLHVLTPETFVDQEITDALAAALLQLLQVGVFDDLPKSERFAELSYSRLGWHANLQLSKTLIDQLSYKGLAQPSEDGVSVPLHPAVRTTILVLLAQLARAAGKKSNLDLHPITADAARIDDLLTILSWHQMPTQGHVISMDLETVTLNLEDVPLEEVLQFRDEHRDEHRRYSRSVRKAIVELSVIPFEDRPRAFADRREDLADQADALRRLARRRWSMPMARFGLGAAGAAVNAIAGNVPGAIISALSGVLGAKPGNAPASAYSYLFRAERTFGKPKS